MASWNLFRELDNLKRGINEAFCGIGFGNPFGSTTTYSRKLRLPVEIHIDKSRPSFKDGMLEIRMPKRETEKQKLPKFVVE